MELIDKAAVVAEIEKRIKGLKECHADTVAGYAGEISGLERLLSFLDTIEVKEVDLEAEERRKDCPFRQEFCRYDGKPQECTGACPWVVDYLKRKAKHKEETHDQE